MFDSRRVHPPPEAEARAPAACAVPVSRALCTRLPRGGRHATGARATSLPDTVLARALRSRGGGV